MRETGLSKRCTLHSLSRPGLLLPLPPLSSCRKCTAEVKVAPNRMRIASGSKQNSESRMLKQRREREGGREGKSGRKVKGRLVRRQLVSRSVVTEKTVMPPICESAHQPQQQAKAWHLMRLTNEACASATAGDCWGCSWRPPY